MFRVLSGVLTSYFTPDMLSIVNNLTAALIQTCSLVHHIPVWHSARNFNPSSIRSIHEHSRGRISHQLLQQQMFAHTATMSKQLTVLQLEGMSENRNLKTYNQQLNN